MSDIFFYILENKFLKENFQIANCHTIVILSDLI